MRRVVAAAASTYWLLLILACGGPPAPGTRTAASSQPRTRQQVWEACHRSIQQARCGTDLISGTVCMRQIGDEYFGQPTDADARLVLVRNGCPEGIAGD